MNIKTQKKTSEKEIKGQGYTCINLATASSKKGITLIALVVTIIVLLILAGVSINIALNNNGIFQKAQDAGVEMEKAALKERIETLIVNWKADEIISGVTEERFWKDLEDAGIIEDANAIGNPDSTTTENGVKKDTYTIETTDEYDVDIIVTKDEKGNINITVENIEPSSSTTPKISITDLTSTETSITVKVSTKRMEGGTLTYSYREKGTENWTEWTDTETSSSQTTKTEITITTGIVKDKIYEIKVYAQNNGENKEVIKEISTDKTAPQATVTFSPTTIGTGEKVTATVTLSDVGVGVDLNKSKYVFKKSNTAITDESEFTNTFRGLTGTTTATGTVELTPTEAGDWYLHVLTVDKAGNKTITVITDKITAEKTTDWAEMHKIAKAISDKYATGEITKASDTATVTVEGKTHTLNVGDTFVLKDTSGNKYNVRIMGFNHDKLTSTSSYGGTNTYAGISFEFVDFLLSSFDISGNTPTNIGGWDETPLCTTLNETEINILANKDYIKQVEKKYIVTYNNANSVTTGNYKLWLLSCSEIWNNGYTTGAYGYAIANESTMYDSNDTQTQYQYYAKNLGNLRYQSSYGCEVSKKTSASNSTNWWLRSPFYYYDSQYCMVRFTGDCYHAAGNGYGAGGPGTAPGFCI